jgi:hypothetical protein
MHAQVIHHDDLAGLQPWDQEPCEIDLKGGRVHRSIEQHRRPYARCTHGGDDGRIAWRIARTICTLSTWGSGITGRHVEIGSAFIEDDIGVSGTLRNSLSEGRPLLFIAFCRIQRLFFASSPGDAARGSW